MKTVSETFQQIKPRILRSSSDLSKWEVVIIESGESLNGLYYPAEVLERAKYLFENAPCYAFEFSGQLYDHLPEEVKDKVPAVTKNLVGYFDNVRAQRINGKVALVSNFHIIADWFKNLIRNTPPEKIPQLFGFSIDAEGLVEGNVVKSIEKVNSVDIVSHPAAGGKFLKLLAARMVESIRKTIKGGIVAMGGVKEILETLKSYQESELDADLIKTLMSDVLSESEIENSIDELKEILAEVINQLKEGKDEVAYGFLTGYLEARKKKKAEYPGYPGYPGYKYPEAYPTPEAKKKEEVEEKCEESTLKEIEKLKSELERMKFEEYLEKTLSESGLTEHSKNFIRSAAKTIEDVNKLVKQMKDLEASFIQTSTVATTVSPVEDEGDKLLKMLDDVVEGKASLREAYIRWTGDKYITGKLKNFYEGGRKRITEALTSASWPEALGDSIRRRMIKEYQAPDLNVWRLVVSDIIAVPDFRTQRWIRIGGYGTLTTISEGSAYPELTSPTDEEVTMTISKRGGIETITLEMIKNDDIMALKRIPIKLGRAAAYTLYKAVFDIFATNPTIYDNKSLFHADHNNLLDVPLDHQGMIQARKKMAQQTGYGMVESLNLTPKYLLVPVDLEDIAFKLCRSAVMVGVAPYYSGGPAAEAATTPNIVSIQFKTDFITVSYWTDTNDWCVVCDPNACPTIAVGFLDGKEEPELIIQEMPEVGSVFTHDKISYKIRHVWGITVLDYRGMVKSVVT